MLLYYILNPNLESARTRTPPTILLLKDSNYFHLAFLAGLFFSHIPFIYASSHLRDMSSPMRLGAMATLRDHRTISALRVDFLELLVLPQDDLAQVASFCEGFDGELILHAPEDLPDGRFLDLSSADTKVREDSVRRIREVAKAGRETARPVVVHPGGVSESLLDGDELVKMLRASLEALPDYLWMENMPLHYHYRGRKLLSNLMRTPEEMKKVEDLVAGFTVDVSHAYLGVERDGNANVMAMFMELGEAVRHVHLSDARRPDVEGVMIGDGEVDMAFLPYLHGLPVLLEIWDGHLNGGAGFKEALRRVRR